MTTLVLIVALLLAGPIMFASPRVWVYGTGVLLTAAGLLLWWGLGTLCGWAGALSQCAVVQ